MKKKKKTLKQRKLIFDPKSFLYDFVKWTGALPALVTIRPKFYYLNGKKPKGLYRGRFLVMCNHVSMRDAVIMQIAAWPRRLQIICTEEMVNLKFWGPFFRGVGCIPVNKENVSMKTFKQISEVYRRGHVVGIFPEGHIAEENETNTFKDGVVMIALMNDCPILPIYVNKPEKGKRQLIFIGNRIDYHDYIHSKMPSVEEVHNFGMALFEKEQELAKFAESIIERRNKHRE